MLPSERYGIYEVLQITRDTPLQDVVGVDHVVTRPFSDSDVHRHNDADTVVYIIDGEGWLKVGRKTLRVKKGNRVHIGRGVAHGFRTGASSLTFLSVQAPPILNERTGKLDLEPVPSRSLRRKR